MRQEVLSRRLALAVRFTPMADFDYIYDLLLVVDAID